MRSASTRIAILVLSSILSAGVLAGGNPHGAPPGSAPHTSPPTAAPTQKARALGQPDQSCGSATAPNTPGNAANAPGSAFNPDGNAGTHYAGQQPQNSKNPASVSQYDSACAHQSH
jgi:hypothetical protein